MVGGAGAGTGLMQRGALGRTMVSAQMGDPPTATTTGLPYQKRHRDDIQHLAVCGGVLFSICDQRCKP